MNEVYSICRRNTICFHLARAHTTSSDIWRLLSKTLERFQFTKLQVLYDDHCEWAIQSMCMDIYRKIASNIALNYVDFSFLFILYRDINQHQNEWHNMKMDVVFLVQEYSFNILFSLSSGVVQIFCQLVANFQYLKLLNFWQLEYLMKVNESCQLNASVCIILLWKIVYWKKVMRQATRKCLLIQV